MKVRCSSVHTRWVFGAFLFFFTILPGLLFSQEKADKPRLIVGIMVDGLQQEHIDLFWSYLDPEGFRMLVDQGVSFRQMQYNIVSAGNAADVATVMTGTTPNYHGVAGNNYYDRKTRTEKSILADNNQVGIGTENRYSASKLLSSTLVDELKLASPVNSKCYTIAIDPEVAVMMGGHTANGVTWMDDVYLKWVTTGYYSDGLMSYADDMNMTGSFAAAADEKWQPLFPVNSYVWNLSNIRKAFEYVPSSRKGNGDAETLLRTTPAANKLVTDLAVRLMESEELGRDMYPDILMLQYTVRTPYEQFSTVQSIEKEDMYLRLDQELKRLLAAIKDLVGTDETLLFLFSNRTGAQSPLELGDNKVPAGYFNANRSLALLNTYLMALYGQGQWVEGYSAKNIFLNRRLIEESKFNLYEMQQVCADFMVEFEGVRSAYTAGQILNQPISGDEQITNIRNSYHKNSGGDVVFSLLPGWLEVDNNNHPVGETFSTVSNIPVYFWGWKTLPQKIRKPYYITDIAPTLAYLLDVPYPNASVGKLIEEIVE